MCECIFILLKVFSVGLGVDNQTSFLMESFKLTAFSFHFTRVCTKEKCNSRRQFLFEGVQVGPDRRRECGCRSG